MVITFFFISFGFATPAMEVEPVEACVFRRDIDLTDAIRTRFAECLGWQVDNPDIIQTICGGSYQPNPITPLSDLNEVRIEAQDVSFYNEGRSQLKGNVQVQQGERIVSAKTAYVYRDAQSSKITKIELLGNVRYEESGRLLIARKAILNPETKAGTIEDVLYRITSLKAGAVLPAWGRASFVHRYPNKNYLLNNATYTTCKPQDKSWQIEADTIVLDDKTATGVARNAKLRIYNWPVLYAPYLSFPTSKERKSGFLMPTIGSSNIGGFEYAQPYYWNIAPNYDATFTPHIYSKRGLMLGGQFRYLTPSSSGILNGRLLPDDRAYRNFLENNFSSYSSLNFPSTNRWAINYLNSTQLSQNAHLGINFQQVSDDYFLQDFSSNLAVLTERQLLRQGDLSYTTDHWLFRGMLQSYQTLHPINETPIENVYQRLPELLALGSYNDLPFNASFSVLSQYDQFKWPNPLIFAPYQIPQRYKPEGPRFHLNPALSFPSVKPWGYVTPSIEFVENYYAVNRNNFASANDSNPLNFGMIVSGSPQQEYNRFIPRYSLDNGLIFERDTMVFNQNYHQTLEPRLFYLYVPYQDQTPIPVYDSAYMIFNVDQLFRKNRFSGFDRIGDTNQLSYALTSRWLSNESGIEKAIFSIGQIRYFSKRRVKLCQNGGGYCFDNPLTLGYLSPVESYSPVAAEGRYRFNPNWSLIGDFAWDVHSNSTNNTHIIAHYEPEINHIINIGYSYLTNGDITQVAYSSIRNNPLNQISFSYAWPFNEKWSSLGAYNYNISKQYEMMSFIGIQYDSCCWAVRLIGGRVFQSLNTLAEPKYNNNIYFQILLKGLGSVGNSDPTSTIRSFIPSYIDHFRNG